ncbi:MAG: tyrosine-type recombinase/integrase, partial [Anaerolineales bacterium]
METIGLARSVNTKRTYRNGVMQFLEVLRSKNINPDKTSIKDISEDSVSWFISSLKDYSPSTERLYLTAVMGFFEFVVSENLSDINLPKIRLLIKHRARKPGQRLPQFPQDDIDRMLEYIETLKTTPIETDEERLRNLRDRAFLLTLADTGLRVHEACNLRRGDLDWNEGHALIIGKGNRQAVVRFSRRAQQAIKDYLNARLSLDGASGRPLTSLPVFARHDKGAGKRITPITTATGRNIINRIVESALGANAVGKITPHSLRHYFVTRVLRVSGNLKL